MKLHELARQAQALGLGTGSNATKEQQRAVLERLNIDWDSFYQEVEMDYPLVQTQQDVSETGDVVALHSHAYYEILFIRSGNLQYLIGTRRYRVQRGDILLLRPGVSHRPLFPEKFTEKYDRVVVWLSAEGIDMMQQNWSFLTALDRLPCVLRTSDISAESLAWFENGFRRGVKESEKAAPGWQAVVFSNTLELITRMYRTFCSGEVPEPVEEKRELLDELMSYVENRLAEHINLEDTARHFHVSESTISQLFRKRMGVSYYRYVTQRRLIAAKTMISEGSNLERVAEAVGFTDYSGFYRAFKQEYGISPTKFRSL